MPEWTVADKLRRVRRDSGLNQAEFAERLGLKAQRYSAWESGRNQPPVNEFLALARRLELAFGVAAEWVLGLDVATNPNRPDGGPNALLSGGSEPTQEYADLQLVVAA